MRDACPAPARHQFAIAAAGCAGFRVRITRLSAALLQAHWARQKESLLGEPKDRRVDLLKHHQQVGVIGSKLIFFAHRHNPMLASFSRSVNND